MKKPSWVNPLLGSALFLLFSCAGGVESQVLRADYYNLALDLHGQGLYDRAEFYYRESLTAGGSDRDILYNLALLYLETGKPDQAEERLLLLHRQDPLHRPLLNALGLVSFQREEWEQALEWYDRTLAVYPRDGNALFNSALVLEKMEREEEAKKRWETLWEERKDQDVFSRLYPYYSDALREDRLVLLEAFEPKTDNGIDKKEELLLELYREMGRHDEALALIDSLLNRHLDDETDKLGEAYFYRGEILLSLFQNEDGLTALKEAFRRGYGSASERDALRESLDPDVAEAVAELEKIYLPGNN